MLIAIILFARLGVRLFFKWKEIGDSSPDQDSSTPEVKSKSKTDKIKK